MESKCFLDLWCFFWQVSLWAQQYFSNQHSIIILKQQLEWHFWLLNDYYLWCHKYSNFSWSLIAYFASIRQPFVQIVMSCFVSNDQTGLTSTITLQGWKSNILKGKHTSSTFIKQWYYAVGFCLQPAWQLFKSLQQVALRYTAVFGWYIRVSPEYATDCFWDSVRERSTSSMFCFLSLSQFQENRQTHSHTLSRSLTNKRPHGRCSVNKHMLFRIQKLPNT